ncbi:AraC family transcriptional regulator [Vibrio proteolyticus]
MALIDATTRFNADALTADVIGIAARVGKHDSGMHQHNKAQLLYAPQGCITFTIRRQQYVLPPTRAAWIPAGVPHCATMNNVVEYRSVYFDAHLAQAVDTDIRIVEVNALLQALIERMAFWPWDKPKHDMQNTCALFFEEFQQAPVQHLSLPLPEDRRLAAWLTKLHNDVTMPPPLNQVCQQVGASSKTITRIFQRETGMPYQDWRAQWRLLKAIEHLSGGAAVNDVADRLAFSSDSAFIAFFRQHTGRTPRQYLQTSD